MTRSVNRGFGATLVSLAALFMVILVNGDVRQSRAANKADDAASTGLEAARTKPILVTRRGTAQFSDGILSDDVKTYPIIFLGRGTATFIVASTQADSNFHVYFSGLTNGGDWVEVGEPVLGAGSVQFGFPIEAYAVGTLYVANGLDSASTGYEVLAAIFDAEE